MWSRNIEREFIHVGRKETDQKIACRCKVAIYTLAHLNFRMR